MDQRLQMAPKEWDFPKRSSVKDTAAQVGRNTCCAAVTTASHENEEARVMLRASGVHEDLWKQTARRGQRAAGDNTK